jgi:hypothetical protein
MTPEQMDERPVTPRRKARRSTVWGVFSIVVVAVAAVGGALITREGAAPVAPAAAPSSAADTTTTTRASSVRVPEPLSRAELTEEFRRLYPDLAPATSVQLVEWSSAVCDSARAGTSVAEMANRVQAEVPNPKPALRLLVWFGCPEYLSLFGH